MFRHLNNWFNNPAREAARLFRDARYVLEKVVAHYPAEQAAKVATCVSESLGEAREAIATAPSRRTQVVREVQRRHRAARRRNDQPSLSGLTLTLIALQSDKLGDAADEAREAIGDYLERWKHVTAAADENDEK